MSYFYQSTLTICGLVVILVSSLALPVSLLAQNDQESPSQILRELQVYYRSIASLSFTFIQKTEGQMIGRAKTGSGNGLFARTADGRRMRWNYNDPDRQVIISDGRTVTMYFEALNQLIITPVSESQADILFSFFAGQGELEKNFTVLDTSQSPADGSEPGSKELIAIQLVPNNADSQLSMITVYATADKLIRRITLVDHFETKTTITIANVVLDPFASKTSGQIEAAFSFTPPEGTEIIKQ